MTCPHCASTITTGRSKTTQLGYRTFFCRDCRRTFNERTGTPFNYLEFPTVSAGVENWIMCTFGDRQAA